ncbi:MAG: hypothetical protein ACXU82_16965 [Caulobacteraceae bacterium]
MSHYALKAILAHQRALDACDPDLRCLLEGERSLWLEMESQSRMLDMLARSMRRARGEAQDEAPGSDPAP